MAPSDQADSELAIRLEAETGSAERGVESAARDISGALQGVAGAAEEAGNAAAGAMEKTAREAKKAGEEVKKVGEHAKMSAGQLRMVAVGMTGMAIGAIGAYQENHGGRSAGLAYTQGALSAGLQGAAMGGMVGGVPGAVIGGVAGAAVGAFTTYQQREAAEKAETEAREKSIASMREQVELYESLRARTEAFQKTLAGLSAAEAGAAQREEDRQREISRREAEDARLAQAQRDAAASNDADSFRSLSRDRQINAQELAALKNLKIADAPEKERRGSDWTDPTMGDRFAKMGMNLFGGERGVDMATQYAREGNDIARQQLAALNRIETQQTTARWG
ncbi:MAG: hypothetical protein IJL06_04960 [Kiritimatiellae bacterium]|nr:hypothetical protein [Kiritimatiellia bacterium]